MINVLHVPGNIELIGYANSDAVQQAETPLKPPIQLDALLAYEDWDSVDVLHLHTVEFATAEQLKQLAGVHYSKARCIDVMTLLWYFYFVYYDLSLLRRIGFFKRRAAARGMGWF